MNSETQLATLVEDKLIAANIVKRAVRGENIDSDEFTDLPAILFWYDHTKHKDEISGGSGYDVDGGIFVTDEYPVFGGVIFASSQDEALDTWTAAKKVISGFVQDLDEAQMMLPLKPIMAAVPFQYKNSKCIGFFVQTWLQIQNGYNGVE